MELKAFIVHAMGKNGGEIDGEVRLQKLFYFCKALVADLKVHYGLSIYQKAQSTTSNQLDQAWVNAQMQEPVIDI